MVNGRSMAVIDSERSGATSRRPENLEVTGDADSIKESEIYLPFDFDAKFLHFPLYTLAFLRQYSLSTISTLTYCFRARLFLKHITANLSTT
jgi:hypothetical protein